MDLVLVRHGESEWNKLNLFTGWTDVGLSEKGRQEAVECGELLLTEGFDFDICYTSYLKRAIHTLNGILEVMDREWLPVIKNWKFNERHYGALQGLNKAETALKYGEEQVQIWRRSYAISPPPLVESDHRNPRMQTPYRNENKKNLPLAESLAATVERVIPYFTETVLKDIHAKKRVLLVAHGNSLRALIKHLDTLSDEEIVKVNIPTGAPLVYSFDKDFKVVKRRYLGDSKDIEKRTTSVVRQGKL